MEEKKDDRKKFKERMLNSKEGKAVLAAVPDMVQRLMDYDHNGNYQCESFQIGDDDMTTLSIKIPTKAFISNANLEECLVENDCVEMAKYLLDKNLNKSLRFVGENGPLEVAFLGCNPSVEMIKLYVQRGIFTIENLMTAAKKGKREKNIIDIAKAAQMSIEDIVELLI